MNSLPKLSELDITSPLVLIFLRKTFCMVPHFQNKTVSPPDQVNKRNNIRGKDCMAVFLSIMPPQTKELFKQLLSDQTSSCSKNHSYYQENTVLIQHVVHLRLFFLADTNILPYFFFNVKEARRQLPAFSDHLQ